MDRACTVGFMGVGNGVLADDFLLSSCVSLTGTHLGRPCVAQ